jgi:hypothetical protein
MIGRNTSADSTPAVSLLQTETRKDQGERFLRFFSLKSGEILKSDEEGSWLI